MVGLKRIPASAMMCLVLTNPYSDIPMPEQPLPNRPRVIPSPNKAPVIPGHMRNQPCPCGSGKKRKRCGCDASAKF